MNIKQEILKVLPNLSDEIANSVSTDLTEQGVDELEDLGNLREDELHSSLSRIKRRRLINAWKGEK